MYGGLAPEPWGFPDFQGGKKRHREGAGEPGEPSSKEDLTTLLEF